MRVARRHCLEIPIEEERYTARIFLLEGGYVFLQLSDDCFMPLEKVTMHNTRTIVANGNYLFMTGCARVPRGGEGEARF